VIVPVRPIHAEPLNVGAPPSLRAAFQEIIPLFEREYRTTVTTVYTPSKALLKEIEKGASIDVFVSAGLEELDYLHAKGLTINETRVLAETSLVLVMATDSPARFISFDDALANHTIRIAVGDPEMSYFGEVTVRALSKLHPSYKSHTRILYAPHTEDILRLVRSGKADVGVVYRANVINHGDVRISDETPFRTELHVQFGQVVVSTCRPSLRSVAAQFSDFLMTPRVLRLLEKYGFDAAPLPAERSGPVPASSRSKTSHK